MQLNGKEVRIVPSKSSRGFYTEDEQGYVYLQHKDIYEVAFANNSREKCDVVIEIDGKIIGEWRLNAYCKGQIEHGADDTGKFTFYEIGSVEARQTELTSVSNEKLGLVTVTFIPELASLPGIPVLDSYSGAKGGVEKGGDFHYESFSGPRGSGQSVDLAMTTRGAGGTGLSGRSSQVFGRAERIDRDYDRQTVINLRLVAKPNDEPRPLRAVNSTVSNLVPPPVN
jgi:hypothetical protein